MNRRMMIDTNVVSGDIRLLHDLAVLQIAFDDERVPARERLEGEIGPGVAALARRSLHEPTARAA